MNTSARSLARAAAVIGAICSATSPGAAIAPAVEWEAPSLCPDMRALHERVTSLLGREPELVALRVRGVIVETDAELRLTLEVASSVRRSSRVFVARDCSELFEAAALAITLAVPDAHAEERLVGPQTKDSASASPEAGAPLVDVALPEDDAVLGWSAGAGAVVDFGALPEPAFGVSAGAGARLGPWSLGVLGSFFPAQALRVASSTDVEFGLVAFELRACRRVLESVVSVQPCVGFELGQLSAWGLDLDSPRTIRSLWLAPAAALEGRAALAPGLSLSLRAASLLPLGRKQYGINGTDAVHAPAEVDLRFFAGLVVDLH